MFAAGQRCYCDHLSKTFGGGLKLLLLTKLSGGILLPASPWYDESLKQQYLNHEIQKQVDASDRRQTNQTVLEKSENLSRDIQS